MAKMTEDKKKKLILIIFVAAAVIAAILLCCYIFGIFTPIKSVDKSSGEPVTVNDSTDVFTTSEDENAVKDKAPVMLSPSSVTVVKGGKTDFISGFLIGDDVDKSVDVQIIGTYDFNTVGDYSLYYYAKDSAGNETKKAFTLHVIEKSSSSSSSSSTAKAETLQFSDLLSKYKNDNTAVGIDVSRWQGYIDWNKIKNAGCEFAILRLGLEDSDGKIYRDKQFYTYIKNAKSAGMPVGVYFHSTAVTIEEAKEQADYVIDILKEYDLDYPVAFDWESWEDFKDMGISFNDLNEIADTFLSTVSAAGYDTYLYGSTIYFQNVWNLPQYKKWIANYSSNMSYSETYSMRQITNNCTISGCSTVVDVDVLYK